ncbi:MAG: DUF4358 domain-containing protein [Eubacteriales bacterium]
MSRIYRTFVLIVTASLLLTSCNMRLKLVTPYSLSQIAEAVITSQDSISALQPLLPDDDYYAVYLSDVYGIKTDTMIDGAIYYADGMLADEISVFLLPDNSSAGNIKDMLVKYKERRLDAFTGYAPAQAAILENGVVVTHGNYAALLICENPQKAEAVFLACFSDNPPKIKYTAALSSSEDTEKPPDADSSGLDNEIITEEPSDETKAATSSSKDDINPPDADSSEADNQKMTEEPFVETVEKYDNKDGIFDSADLLEAWRSGDTSRLSDKSRSVLDACIEIIGTMIDIDMSDYEKELVIHDWMIDWTDYDEEANNNSPDAEPDPDNDNPYGVIIQKKAVCYGYTAAFQLFMDMLDIECISVKGISQNTGGEHAWNMVRINGEWYCVDVTWNDYFGEDKTIAKKHRYFNVTSQYMRDTKHQWDESKTPIADAGKLYNE